MDDLKPNVPQIYLRMERGEVSRWWGFTVLCLSWLFLIIPVLLLTLPVWGPIAVYQRFKKKV
jgi:hypothetical protein